MCTYQSILPERDNPVDFVQLIVCKNGGTPKEKTMGGIWWKEVEYRGDFRLQQNLISNHYRILDQYGYRFNKEESLSRLNELRGDYLDRQRYRDGDI
ncbi:hypothetical protein J7J00_25590 [Bacillus sp. ISL-4]|uniref:hypothetical protein n=1 Tax=Bacillus sp. ISL-4 TaxID=2819125 RepID=UPI001BE60FC4|nr:hypothetical protein [Bacillus sp. ISL-4]MBT2668782.1 hypothetical protein [Bacillus sp. ISL-4]MBT2673952.1 hypothetical protein [Streptomyces sp. ISL-14]